MSSAAFGSSRIQGSGSPISPPTRSPSLPTQTPLNVSEGVFPSLTFLSTTLCCPSRLFDARTIENGISEHSNIRGSKCTGSPTRSFRKSRSLPGGAWLPLRGVNNALPAHLGLHGFEVDQLGRVRYSPFTKWTGSSEATDLDQISPERLALNLLDNATTVR